MIQHRRYYVAAAALACLIVAGCERKAVEGTKATGEVLEGTISDAMIATEEVRSEPSLAPHTVKPADTKADKTKGKARDGDKAEAVPVTDASPTAAAAPAPQPVTADPTG